MTRADWLRALSASVAVCSDHDLFSGAIAAADALTRSRDAAVMAAIADVSDIYAGELRKRARFGPPVLLGEVEPGAPVTAFARMLAAARA